MKKNRPVRLWLWIPLACLVVLGAVFLIYVSDYYRADVTALDSLEGSETVSVSRTSYGWKFDGPGEEKALIFYPGGKVEETAYAPLLSLLAEGGLDVCLLKVPFRLAILDASAAGKVLQEEEYDVWYIGGHSLGGVVASLFASDHPDSFRGIVFLASYPSKTIPTSMSALSITGTEDGVLDRDKEKQSGEKIEG
ncbi:MAG: carboxymethylenebutenolidase, partial [Clostridia bacterium]|nr:carboxymethylenebutenolidase [Clostridia bacterium]